MILAIDPGNIESAFVITNDNLVIRDKGKIENGELIKILTNDFEVLERIEKPKVAIEMLACYGQRVGKEVFDTCVMVGRIVQVCESLGIPYQYVYRKDEMQVLCGGQNNGDGGIRRTLIERFALHDFKTGKGTKKNPDVFYGFAKDMWAAMAVAVTYHEMYLEKK